MEELKYETLLMLESDMSNAKKDRSLRQTKRKALFKERRRRAKNNVIVYGKPELKNSGIPRDRDRNSFKRFYSKERRNVLKKDMKMELAMAAGE